MDKLSKIIKERRPRQEATIAVCGDLVAGSSAPDDPTHRRCIASE
jgi:hypothetical protein